MKEKVSSDDVSNCIFMTLMFAFYHALAWAFIPAFAAKSAGRITDVSFLVSSAIFVFVVHCFLHILIGRAVVWILHRLTAHVDHVFSLEGDQCTHQWSAAKSLRYGSIWPISMWLIPYYLVGVAMGACYRELFDAWNEPAEEEETSVSVPMRKLA